MIITEIIGGLGNQLFEYAHAKALSLQLKQDLFFDLSFFERYHRKDVYRLDKFNTNINLAPEQDIFRLKRKEKTPDIYRKLIRKLGRSGYNNSKYYFDNERLDKTSIGTITKYKDIFVSGFYADQKYFMDIEDVIRKEFTLMETFNLVNQKMLQKIENSNAVSLHIRRGDYIGNSFFAAIPLSYYENAIKFIELQTEKKNTYFVFSDDMAWVRENLKIDKSCIFVDINDSSTDYMELALMSACKHNIIANSTFSWWGAWLNPNKDKKVIAPKVWYNNKEAQVEYEKGSLVPNNWFKV